MTPLLRMGLTIRLSGHGTTLGKINPMERRVPLLSSPLAFSLFDPDAGQGLRQLAELCLALVLSTLIGAERAIQQKSAGLRTYRLVVVGRALFMEVSLHGFNSVLGMDSVSFDP